MGLLPETRNVIQLGSGFFFIFLAFNSQGEWTANLTWSIFLSGFIEEPVISSSEGIAKGAGYYR